MKIYLYRSGVVLLAAVGLWIAINLFDESPDPSLPPLPIAHAFGENAKDNGFFALVGIGEPQGRTTLERHAAGLTRYKGEIARDALYWQQPRTLLEGGPMRVDLPGPSRPALVTALKSDSLCDWRLGACLEQFSQRREKEIEKPLREHQWLYARYRELYAYPTFAIPVPDDPAFLMEPSPFDGLRVGSALVQATAGLAALDGQGKEALDLLAADIRFQHRLLQNPASLLQTSTAAMNMARDLSLLDEIVNREPKFRDSAKQAIAEAVRPLGPTERDLAHALRGHFFGLVHLADVMAKGPHWQTAIVFSRPVFRRQAYVNAEWARLQALTVLLTRTPADEIPERFAAWQRQHTFPASGIWPAVRNPLGTYMTQLAVPSSTAVFLSLHDLDAYQRMLAIKFGGLAIDAPTPAQGFQSRAIARSKDGLQLSFTPAPDSRWPQRLTAVAHEKPELAKN